MSGTDLTIVGIVVALAALMLVIAKWDTAWIKSWFRWIPNLRIAEIRSYRSGHGKHTPRFIELRYMNKYAVLTGEAYV